MISKQNLKQKAPKDRWFYTQCQGQYNDEGKLVSKVGFLNDITQRKESELAIKESEQQYRNILNLSPDGIIMITGRGNIIDISPMAARMLQCSVESAKTATICDLMEGEAEVLQMRNLINKAWNSSRVEAEEFIFKSAKGSLICEITAKTVQLSNSRTKRIMLNMRDISDRKIMTQKLIRSERLVSLGEMATAMAHEINQPLLSISLSLDNLMDRINKVAPQESDYIKKKG